MAPIPYMPFYVADYMADTAHLTALGHGAYMLLIMTYWQRGEPLPADDRKLSRIARLTEQEWLEVKDDIVEFFHAQDGVWKHSRVEHELDKARRKIENSRKAGQASAQQSSNGRSTPVQRPSNHTEEEGELDKDIKVKEEAACAAAAGFSGRVIRLKPEQLDRWKTAFSKLDLSACLQSRDDWLAEEADENARKNWFISTSTWLKNENGKVKNGSEKPKRTGVAQA